MFDIITIGDSTLDTFLILDKEHAGCSVQQKRKLLCLRYADKISITNSAQSVGGNAANVAVGARKLGLNSAIVTELGDDINGHEIFEELTRAKVNTSLIKMLPNHDTRYSIVLNFQSERTILSHHAKREYTLPQLPKTKWIYYTSLGKGFEKVQRKLISYLKKNDDVKLAVNPGSYQFKQGLSTIKKILPRTDLLIVNKDEARELVGKRVSARQCIRALHNTGVKTVVVTDSIHGSHASDGEQVLFMPAYPIKPVAKTGAGDAYTSGFLTAYMTGKTLGTAMQWGTANAGGVIQAFGAQRGLLNRNQIGKIAKKYRKTKPVAVK